MAVVDLAPVLEASAFPLGFLLIHALQRYARLLSLLLVAVAVGLFLTVMVKAELVYGVPATEMVPGFEVDQTAGF